MILPCDNLMLRSEASQREPKGLNSDGHLNYPVEKLLGQFFEQEVGLHVRLEDTK